MFYLTFFICIYPLEWLFLLADVPLVGGSSVFLGSPVSGVIFDFYFSIRHVMNSFFLSNYVAITTCVTVMKLIGLWFFVVWLRMNLVRYRFDQVASYTWHELVILGVCLIIHVIILVWVL